MSRRDEPNWIAFGLSLVYIVCFLALPFYRIFVLSMSGWSLLSINAVMCLPLVLGMLMALASLLFDIRISIAVAAVSAVTVFVLMLTGNSVLDYTAIVQQNLASFVAQTVDFSQSVTLQLVIGVGAVFSLLLAIAVLVLEILALAPKKTYKPIDRYNIDF